MKLAGLFALALLAASACSGGAGDEPSGPDDRDGEVDEDGDLPSLVDGSAVTDAATSTGDGGGDGDGDGDREPDGAAGEPADGGADPSDAAPADSGRSDSGGSTCMPAGEVEHEHTSEPAAHIAEAMPPSAYNSSPPSSGPHCETWGHYAAYNRERPLPACNFLHNLEHGAIVLLYNCPEGCPEVTDALGGILAAPPDDPDCLLPRIALTPYEDMDAKVAAVAWGFTWTSDCIDAAARQSLEAFIEQHIGSRGDAPEATACGNGAYDAP